MSLSTRRTRGSAAAALAQAEELPIFTQAVPPLMVPSPLGEPRTVLADEPVPAGTPLLGNSSSIRDNSRIDPQASAAPLQLMIAEPKPMEIEHLSNFSKLEEHFNKFFTRSGTGQYAAFLSQELQEVLAFQFSCWRDRQPPTADYDRSLTFATASRQALQPFIKYYVNTEIKHFGVNKLAEGESGLRDKLMELGFHSFLDINSDRMRIQDHSVNHVEVFISNIIRIFVAFQRSSDNFLFPVQELATYREVLTTWIKDIRDSAPLLTTKQFDNMAKDFTDRYLSDSTVAFERDNHALGPFLRDLRARFVEVERRFVDFNSMCGPIKVEKMAIMLSNLEPAALAELERLSSTTLRKSTNMALTASVAQAATLHTPHDAHKVKGGAVGKRKSFSTDLADKGGKKANNNAVGTSNLNPKVDVCNHCGKSHVNANTTKCRSVINKHPNANLDLGSDGKLIPWEKSVMGMRLKAYGIPHIYNNHYVDKNNVKRDFVQPSSVVNTNFQYNLSMMIYSHSSVTLRGMLGVDWSSGLAPSYQVMLDSGATANFIRRSCVPEGDLKAGALLGITLANGSTIFSNKSFFVNEFIITHLNHSITLRNTTFIVLDTLPSDIILGMPTIKENCLTIKFPEYWGADHLPPSQETSPESIEHTLKQPAVNSSGVKSPTVQPLRTLYTFTTVLPPHFDQSQCDGCGEEPVANGTPRPAPSGCSVIALVALQMSAAGPPSVTMDATHTEYTLLVRVNKSELLGDMDYVDGIPQSANLLPTYFTQESDKTL